MSPHAAMEAVYAPHVGVVGRDEVRFEAIVDNGHEQGVLVESPLERVALFIWREPSLRLSDISRLRWIMRRIQARRAVLYVPIGITVPGPVSLMAALSKIAMTRPSPNHDEL
ncbi:MAG TPA: hypothetical protein VHQ67_02835 [Nitrospiraceae bacterium]|nr:hypothetical protein [Nitrospiraceae bacterium]